jgi:hypothetical protein
VFATIRVLLMIERRATMKSLFGIALLAVAAGCGGVTNNLDGGGGNGGDSGANGGGGSTAGGGAGGGGGGSDGTCGAQGASGCAAGGLPCCAGLMCCAGIPAPDVGACYGSPTCPVSDRDQKTGLSPVDREQVLAKVRALPISTWSYRFENERVRHMGPMAQDFHASLGLGADDKHIHVVDAGGVSLAAIQALAARTDELARKNAALRAENDLLRRELARLERRLDGIARR